MTTYSNPRTHATVPDWPSGGQRVTAFFAADLLRLFEVPGTNQRRRRDDDQGDDR